MTTAQIMLIDILTDRIIKMGTAIAKAKTMTDEEANKEIAFWKGEKAKEEARLNSH